MIKVGQQYRADKSQIVIEIIGTRMQRHPGAKPEWKLKPYATDSNTGRPADDFYYWQDEFEKEVKSGRWVLSHDPEAEPEEMVPTRSRLDDID